MAQLLRFQLYDNPSRDSYNQIHPDIPLEDMPPHFKYGYPIRLGDDEVDKKMWAEYRIAHLTKIRQEPDPDRSGKNRIVYEVYLARQEDWSRFEVPKEFAEQTGRVLQ